MKRMVFVLTIFWLIILAVPASITAEPASKKGATYPAEWRILAALDPAYEVVQLTTDPRDDCKLYYTTNPYIAATNQLIFASARTGARNLFAIDLASGTITQLTDGKGIDAEHAVVCPKTLEVFYRQNDTVKALRLDRLTERVLYRFNNTQYKVMGSISISSDGTKVAFPLVSLGNGPQTSKLMTVNSDGSQAHEVCTVSGIINHAYLSPQFADRLMFMVVDGGMWLVQADGKNRRCLRSETAQENVSHPFWYPDGIRIGYTIKQKPADTFGSVDSATGEYREPFRFPAHSTHCNISPDAQTLVGDGDVKKPFLILYQITPERLIAKTIFRHGSSFRNETVHPHPTFINRTDVAFNSDHAGNGDIYILRKRNP